MKVKKRDLLLLLLLLFLLPMFFYGLGKGSLVSFDEAWHAQVAREIIKRKNIFILWWNGRPFLEQPTTGFWLTALSFSIFGINEFAARFSSALLGFASALLVYKIGRSLFGRLVGFLSAFMLTSSVWFMVRARSGNLDTVVVFFILLSFYAAIKIFQNRLWLYVLAMAMAFLLLTKYLVGLGITPVLFYFFYKNKKKLKFAEWLKPFVLFLAILLPYYLLNCLYYRNEFLSHIWGVASRGIEKSFRINYYLPLFYLHMGIREWYYPALIAFFGNLFFIKKTEVKLVYLYIIFFFLPFLVSSKTEIWHLIPLYPALGLMIFSFVDNCHHFFLKLFEKKKILKKYKNLVANMIITGGMLFSLKQINEFRREVFLKNTALSNEAKLSVQAAALKEPLYIADYYLPEAVFYSGRQVNLVGFENKDSSLRDLFDRKESFLLLTTRNVLQDNNIDNDKYLLIAQEEDKILVKKK